MKIKEIKDKETDAIKTELTDAQRRLFDMRTQAVTEKLENPSQLKNTRRDIARMKTVLRQRDLQEQGKSQNNNKAKAQAK